MCLLESFLELSDSLMKRPDLWRSASYKIIQDLKGCKTAPEITPQGLQVHPEKALGVALKGSKHRSPLEPHLGRFDFAPLQRVEPLAVRSNAPLIDRDYPAGFHLIRQHVGHRARTMAARNKTSWLRGARAGPCG